MHPENDGRDRLDHPANDAPSTRRDASAGSGDGALQAHDAFLSAILDGIQDGISVLNTDLSIRHTNAIMRDWYAENLPLEGKKCFACYHNSSEPCDPCPTLRCLESGQVEKDVVPGLPGSPVEWIELFSYPLRDGETGEITGVIEFVRDITERRRAEKALRESEEKYRRVVETCPDSVTVLDPQGTVLLANEQFARMHGLASPAAWYGKSALDWVAPEDREKAMHVIQQATREGLVTNVSVSFLRGDGQRFPVEVSGNILTREGSALTLMFIARDVSERKHAEAERERLEAELRQAQKMEAVGQLAGGVAHDFNNLLQAILGYGEMALNRLPRNSTREFVEQIMEAGHRARSLVGQLLAFSRRQVLRMENLDLNEVVANLMKMLRRLIGEHMTLEVIPGHNLGTVRADRGQIGQILTNLCINARDAMPGGGTITIRTQNVVFDESESRSHPTAKPGTYVLLSVTDTGCGMDSQTLERAFEPFFTTKEVGKGTGLGLATVYGLVSQHAGTMEVRSAVGEGSTFSVYLPQTQSSAPAATQTEEPPVSGGSETILLAEDDSMVRDMCQGLLEQGGYTVLAARDGEEALEILDRYTDGIHLALLDVVMPRLGGRAVFDRIRADYPNMPILFASGYSLETVHTDFILNEQLTLIQKPYRRDDLLRHVRAALDGSSRRA